MGVDGDWTWVLDRACPDCGLDAKELERKELGARIRSIGGAWRELLGRGSAIETKPTSGDRTWSVLEYGGHVNDVLELFEERVRAMLKKRKPPTFRDWDQGQAAADGDYANQDPAKVAYDLASRAGKFADLVDRVSGDEWDKAGSRSDGAEFTVDSLTRYMIHDIEHHLWDARQILEA